MSGLDVLLGEEEGEPSRSRGRAALGAFVLAVVTAAVGLVLLALLLYAGVAGGAALWEHFWDDFA